MSENIEEEVAAVTKLLLEVRQALIDLSHRAEAAGEKRRLAEVEADQCGCVSKMLVKAASTSASLGMTVELYAMVLDGLGRQISAHDVVVSLQDEITGMGLSTGTPEKLN